MTLLEHHSFSNLDFDNPSLMQVLIFDINVQGDNVILNASDIIPTNGDITSIKFSPDKTLLGMSTGKKQVKVVETTNYDSEKINQASHAVRVNNIAWVCLFSQH